MDKEKIRGTISIARRNDNLISIRIEDSHARIEFVSATMTADAFGKALTGLANQAVILETRGLEYVGKQRITEQRKILCPHQDVYQREFFEDWLEKNAPEKAPWIVSTYLGSQNSVVPVRGKGYILHYSVTKFVDYPE